MLILAAKSEVSAPTSASRAAEAGASLRPRSGRRRYSVRSRAALLTAIASRPRSCSSDNSDGTASAECTASRACAWASENSNECSVARLTPVRSSAIRAGVSRRTSREARGPSVAASSSSSLMASAILAPTVDAVSPVQANVQTPEQDAGRGHCEYRARRGTRCSDS